MKKDECPAADQIVEIPVEGLELHPALKRVPKMSDREYTAFAEDVKAKGVTDPIIRQADGPILDGRHRLQAQRDAGHATIPARIVNLSEEEQEDYVYRSSALRRHLSDDQRAMLAHEWKQVLSKRAKSERGQKGGTAGGRGRSKDADSLPDTADQKLSAGKQAKGKTSRKEASEGYNVSERKVQQAAQVMNADPKLAARVLKGELSLQKARRELKKATPQTNGQGDGEGKPTDQKPLAPHGPQTRAVPGPRGGPLQAILGWR